MKNGNAMTEPSKAAPLPQLDVARLPRHVAIIMDGNGRWARDHGVPHVEGHEAGARSVRHVVEACRELGGIEVLTLYAFSTENWRRSRLEVESLFRLLSKYIRLELDNIAKEDIRVTIMGRSEGLPPKTLEELRHCEAQTRGNASMTLNVAFNYGGRAEIVDGVRAVARRVQQGELAVEDIDEAAFARHLYVPDLPELDLLIRTSGEMRISNFMLWHLYYTELVVTPVLWPDFRKPHLYEAIAEFQARGRRFGGR
jgi:undecaprenyl diphosphate synthase